MATLEIDAVREVQAQFDEALRRIGDRAPAYSPQQSPLDYVREACRTIKRRYLPQNHDYYRVNYRGLRADALQAIVPQLLRAAVAEAKNPDNLAPGEIRRIDVLGPDGQKWIDWIGRESFVKDMGRPGRRVIGFRTPHGLEMTKS